MVAAAESAAKRIFTNLGVGWGRCGAEIKPKLLYTPFYSLTSWPRNKRIYNIRTQTHWTGFRTRSPLPSDFHPTTILCR